MGGRLLVLCVGGPPPPWRVRGGARSGSAYPAVLSGSSFHALRSTEGPRCFEERERSCRIELPDMPNRCELLLVLAKEVVGLRRKEPVISLPSSHEPTLQIELLQTPQRFTRTQGLQRR